MLMTGTGPTSIDGPRAIDFFCGMGGSTTGLHRAGFDVRLAANHWKRAIETHSANHPGTDHWCADLSAYQMTCLPKADLLWASPICTEVSPAGGTKSNRTPDMDMFEHLGHVPAEAFEKTRITFWEVLRACEVQRFPIVLIENVVDVAWKWELFEVWLAGMRALGYEAQFVSVSAAHIGDETNPHAPQWRDRLYIAFNQAGVRKPYVEPHPLAHCPTCDTDVAAMQAWKKPGRHIGKYRAQYVYVCPDPRCRGQVVEPFVLPAAAAIDWTNMGHRIGDRVKPLAPATMRRIQKGLDTISAPYFGMAVNHDSARYFDPSGNPLPTRSTKNGEALVMQEPFVSTQRRNSIPFPAGMGALPTFTAGGFHHELTIPPGAFIQKHHGGEDYAGVGHMVKDPARDPLPSMVNKANNSLVIPYRKGSKIHRAVDGPVSTMSTVDTHTLVTPNDGPLDINDCYFRMLTPREAANAQAFPKDYLIHGNPGEQQMQAGNAVATNVACWLGRAARASLDAA